MSLESEDLARSINKERASFISGSRQLDALDRRDALWNRLSDTARVYLWSTALVVVQSSMPQQSNSPSAVNMDLIGAGTIVGLALGYWFGSERMRILNAEETDSGRRRVREDRVFGWTAVGTCAGAMFGFIIKHQIAR